MVPWSVFSFFLSFKRTWRGCKVYIMWMTCVMVASSEMFGLGTKFGCERHFKILYLSFTYFIPAACTCSSKFHLLTIKSDSKVCACICENSKWLVKEERKDGGKQEGTRERICGRVNKERCKGKRSQRKSKKRLDKSCRRKVWRKDLCLWQRGVRDPVWAEMV